MKYLLILTIKLFCCSIAYAESIIGLGQVCTSPNKDAIILLYDGVKVDCSKINGGWYNIIIRVKGNEDNYENQKSLKKGDKLIDWNNKEIGIVLHDVPMEVSDIWTSGGAEGNPKIFGIDIYCCIHQSCIDPKSIIENQLTSVINNNSFLNYDIFKNIIKDFDFYIADNIRNAYPKLVEYAISDNYYDAPSDRIRLIFDNSKLIAVVFTRELNIKKGKVYDLVNDKKILILSKIKYIKLKAFIESNIRSYDAMGRD